MRTARPPRSARALLVACAGLVASAALLWGASSLTWYEVPRSGTTVAVGGAQVSPSLTGTALLALAGVAALVATGGVVRRVLGGLLGLVGVVVVVLAVPAFAGPTFPAAPGTSTTLAPLLVVVGGVVLGAVGVVVMMQEARLPRLGARYAAPGKRPAEVEPDRAAWQDLDAGRDPTADAPGDRGDDPDDGVRTGPV